MSENWGRSSSNIKNIEPVSIGFLLAVILLLMTGSTRLAQGATKRIPNSLRVLPSKVTLWGKQASQRFVVLGNVDGLERDLTSVTKFYLSDEGLGEIAASGMFVAHRSGEGRLTAKVGGKSAQATLHIEHAETPPPFTFAREIEGILTQRGCNDVTCHGGVKGRGGLRLSTYGIAPQEDYKWIVEGGTFRVLTTDESPKYSRVDLKEPDKSLLLLKPTFSVPHGGGLRFEVGSSDYQKIINWIRSGAPYGEEAEQQGARVERVDVTPKELVLQVGDRQQLLVMAYLSNGRQEDLTEHVRFAASDAEVADVSETGSVLAKKNGETNILIRTPGHTLSADVGVVKAPIAKYPKLTRGIRSIDRYSPSCKDSRFYPLNDRPTRNSCGACAWI